MDMASQRLLTAAHERRLVIFAGAGISMAAPTALPSWWDLNQAVVRALGARAVGAVPRARELAEFVISRQKADWLPPDYVAEKIVHSLGHEYFEVLRCVDSDRPNANHLALAELAAAGKLRAIVTTNFDRAIEAAFAARGIALDVRADGAATGELLARWTGFEQRGLPCQLIKLHGTADRPDTIIDTLAQRARGPAPQFLEAVARLMAFGELGVFGFSGVDLETQSDYLGLKSASATGRGLSWFVQTGKEPRKGVTKLITAWRGKADWLHGDLPRTLVELLDGVAPLEPAKSAAKPVEVAPFAAAWAERVAPARATCIVAELLDTAQSPEPARELLDALAATFPQAAWKLKPLGARGGQVVVWAESAIGEPQGTPLGIGAREKPALAVLSPHCELPRDERVLACDVWYGLADLTDRLGDRAAQLDALARTLIEAMAVNDRTRQVRALGLLAEFLGADKKRDEAEALYGAAVELCGERPLTRGNLLTNRARNALAAGGREREAFDWLSRARGDFTAVGDGRGRAGVDLGLGDLYLRAKAEVEALRHFGSAVEFGERVGDLAILYEAWLGVGRVAIKQGQPDIVEPALKRALEAARGLRDPVREQTALSLLQSARKPPRE
jgi:tetratricopeptide (TPR) repeat protein